jgi:hypothetical protein
MQEPTLTAEEKQEWIDAFNEVIAKVNNATFNTTKKELISNDIGCDCLCNIRNILCFVLEKQESLTVHNCSLCWVNWFIHDHELKPTVTDQRIINVFNKLYDNEVEKRTNFACYTLSFEAVEALDKTKITNMANLMIAYLGT